MTLITNNGMISKPSNHSVDETVGKRKSILQARGMTLFALIDQQGTTTQKVGGGHRLMQGL